MNKPIIHIISLPHTIVNNNYSTCAFTGKVLRFSKMMIKYGWTIYEYGNEGSISHASKHLTIIDTNTFMKLKKTKKVDEFYDNDVNNNELITLYWNNVYEIIKKNAHKGDIVCHVFGPNHKLASAVPDCYHIESGIGYMGGTKLNFRIFESYAIMHWHYGKHNQNNGINYNWVVPNYYDLEEWKINLEPKNYIIYFGRLLKCKGLDTIVEIAKLMPDEEFIMCGQGNADHWTSQSKNIKYLPPINGTDRSEFVGNAKCILMPTVYIEPFGGAGVEAQLCGTPLIATNYGCFTETVEDCKTGFLCNTLADWIESIKRIKTIDRQYVADRARKNWSLDTVGKKYDIIFNQIADLRDKGWYATKSHKFEN